MKNKVLGLWRPETIRATDDGIGEGGTAEEDKAAIIGNLALFGTYSVDQDGNFAGNAVQGCTFPKWIEDVRSPEQLEEIADGDEIAGWVGENSQYGVTGADALIVG